MTAKCLTQRSNALGGRVANLLQRGNIKNGHVDFMRGGCYELIFAEDSDEAVSIRHISGIAIPVPPHIRITKAFNLYDNHSDADARVGYDAAWEHNLYKFFACNPVADCINNDQRGTKALQKLVKVQEESKADGEQRQVEVKRGNPELLKTGQDERKKVACQKARQAMEQKRTERVTKRKFGLAALGSTRAASSSAPAAKAPKPATTSAS